MGNSIYEGFSTEKPSGSWRDSARNIVYNGNVIYCELLTINGEYKLNHFTFFPEYEYHNINGKIEWDNCKNNVEINNFSHEHISRRYKEITIRQCLDNLTNEYDDWFEIEKVYLNSIKNKCISISLFKKNSQNTFDNEYDVDNDKWTKKYYDSLINNLNKFNKENFCVNLYLAKNLSNYISELSKYNFLNIFLMKSESIGAQPGMLWRFMNITNKSYQTVFIADIDENWDWVFIYDEKNYDYKLVTLIPSDVLINQHQQAYNFTTIMGGHIMVKPYKFSYNIVDVIKGFLSICKKRETSNNPYCFDDNDKITFWNQPVLSHKFGWGRTITKYGFDEFFLKHVIYYDAYPDLKFV